ncbi:MAG TPA: hypothetical protein PKC65_04275 [Pyrinomonadaceae bacterium]|nr:hypothetical protein [Pyrinomonadaceae bacterium]
MKPDHNNRVIARINEQNNGAQGRTLDLGNILTPELGLLSPRRSEIAPKGPARDAALIAYAARLRDSYRTNEGGLRDGMLKLGEAFREGQTINITCVCRAGEGCHADIVKIAIEKVGHGLNGRQAPVEKSQQTVVEHASTSRVNPRTQRAINEILSVSRSEMLLAKLENTQGWNRSEHASHLNSQSQFVRDLYERGAMVRDGVLISPKETSSAVPPLAITTNRYAVERLSKVVGESRASELAPQIVEHGKRIAGSSADRDTQMKVFNWIYGALDGKNALLPSDEKTPKNEKKEERVERVVGEISGLAEEMSKLEPSDRLELLDAHSDRTLFEDHDRDNEDLSLEKVYEDAIAQEVETISHDREDGIGATQEFERIELSDTFLSGMATEMSKEELERWTEVRLSVLDEALENGTPVDSILRVFQNNVYHSAKEGPSEKQAAIDDLRFASAYVKYQLKQPESRLRHFNARYREYAVMLERASTRDEVIDAASRIRLENARLGFQWETLPEKEKVKTTRPLSSKEMQFLLTESSPRHYTSEMTAAKLSYVSVGSDAKTKTDALIRGEIHPSPEAVQLIDSLESRSERRQIKDSISATRHFLQSLRTPNEELRYKNSFDHAGAYRKLPAAERDFVYQRAVLQKDELESKLFLNEPDRNRPMQMGPPPKPSGKIFSEFRDELKSEILDLLKNGTGLDHSELTTRAVSILDSAYAKNGLTGRADHEAMSVLSRELSEEIGKAIVRRSPHNSRNGIPATDRLIGETDGRENRSPEIYIR